MLAGEILRFVRHRWIGVSTAAGVFLVLAATLGAFDGPAPTRNSRGLRRFVTPEITGATRITEQFVMNRAGLRAIALRAAAVGSVDGDVRIELWRVRDRVGTLVRHGLLHARDAVDSGLYRWDFPPLSDSQDALYVLVLASSTEHPSHGVAFWATRGHGIPQATLMYGTTERWADLAFRTYTVPLRPLRPAGIAAVVILAVSWAVFVRFLAVLHAALRLSP